MLQSSIAYTNASSAGDAGRELGESLTRDLRGEPPHALIVFASPRYDHDAFLAALDDTCHPQMLVGASSAGEFTSNTRGEGLACALAIRSDAMQFTVGLGRGIIGGDRAAVARQVVSTFKGLHTVDYPHRSALILTDALAGNADDLVDQLTLATSGSYQFFGGGAGDNAQFRRTTVFHGRQALTDAVVALEMLSKKPLGIGVGHGWTPASAAMRVTEASGMTVLSINGSPAADAFEDHARAKGQTFDRAAPIPFFLHNILGIETGAGYRLRVPLAVMPEGGVVCAAEIPTGALVNIMQTSSQSAVDAVNRATKSAIGNLAGATPKVALFFDCVATRLRMGDVFGVELDTLEKLLGAAPYVGCNTHGQIARAEGQFGGFHNCTAVVCVLPE